MISQKYSKFVLSLMLMAFSWVTYGQSNTTSRYLVLFKDKANSPFSITKPEEFLSARSIARRQRQGISVALRDLPPNPSYINQIAATGAIVWYKTRWLNGVMVSATVAQRTAIEALGFVRGFDGRATLDSFVSNDKRIDVSSKFGQESVTTVDFLDNIIPQNLRITDDPPLNYGNAANQTQMIGADIMHQKGFRGEGMLIAVLDDGFLNVNTITQFSHLFTDKRVVATYDFVAKKTDVYTEGGHGTNVLSCMAANTPTQTTGTAFKASYALFRTEDVSSESRIEEANWLFAAEFADSLGADVINSSLGYTTFDNPALSYNYARDMNGNTTLSTRAANLAAAVGIVPVIAAGNEGSGTWRYISSPADADSALAVGATDANGNKAGFSSFGPSADRQIKPDVSAKGIGSTVVSTSGSISSANGTSFASPTLCGMVTGFWQSRPYLTAMQVIDLIRKAGSQAAAPDDRLGYGIPTWQRAFDLAPKPLGLDEPTAEGIWVFPNPSSQTDNLNIGFMTGFENREYAGIITNELGQNIWQGRINQQNKLIPFSHVPSGYYFLMLYHSDGTKAFKILKH